MNIAKLILLVIISNSILNNCDKINRVKNRRNQFKHNSKHHKVLSKAQIFIFDKLSEYATEPKNIFYFSLGILSVLNSSWEKFYKDIKPKIEHFEPCVKSVKNFLPNDDSNKEKEENGELEKQKENYKTFESEFLKRPNKEAYCKIKQSKIKKNYKKAYDIAANRFGETSWILENF